MRPSARPGLRLESNGSAACDSPMACVSAKGRVANLAVAQFILATGMLASRREPKPMICASRTAESGRQFLSHQGAKRAQQQAQCRPQRKCPAPWIGCATRLRHGGREDRRRADRRCCAFSRLAQRTAGCARRVLGRRKFPLEHGILLLEGRLLHPPFLLPTKAGAQACRLAGVRPIRTVRRTPQRRLGHVQFGRGTLIRGMVLAVLGRRLHPPYAGTLRLGYEPLQRRIAQVDLGSRKFGLDLGQLAGQRRDYRSRIVASGSD